MKKESNIKECPQCEKPLKGCACSHRKASDGKLVHGKCLEKYNYILKINKDYSEIFESYSEVNVEPHINIIALNFAITKFTNYHISVSLF